jgi:hypothetical protein
MNTREIHKPPTAASLTVNNPLDRSSDSLEREYGEWLDKQMYYQDDRGYYA